MNHAHGHKCGAYCVRVGAIKGNLDKRDQVRTQEMGIFLQFGGITNHPKGWSAGLLGFRDNVFDNGTVP